MPIDERVSALFLKNQAMINEYVRALVHNHADAADLCQDIGVRILTSARPPESDSEFPKWARGVARNTVLHYWRSRKRSRLVVDSQLAEAVDLAYEEADGESDVLETRRTALQKCMGQIEGTGRKLLDWRYAQGLTSRQIGKIMGRTPVAVRVMLHRILAVLAECIRSHAAESEGAS